MIGWFCPFCGAMNTGTQPGSVPPTIELDGEDQPSQPVPKPSSNRSIITTVSQLQPGRSEDALAPLKDAATRAQYKNMAALKRTESIDGRPSGQIRSAVKADRARTVATKIAFDVSFVHVIWINNTFDRYHNISGGDVGIIVPGSAKFENLDDFVDRFIVNEIEPIRLRSVAGYERTYAIKMGTLPQLFPRSAHTLTTMQDLLEKVPWKETGTTRKFVVCFNEYQEENNDEPLLTPTPVTKRVKSPSKSPVKRATGKKIKVEPLDFVIKKEKPSSITPKTAEKSTKASASGPLAGSSTTLASRTRTPSRKRGRSQIARSESPLDVTTPQAPIPRELHDDLDDWDDIETLDLTNIASDGLDDLSPVKDALPSYSLRYPRRAGGVEDVQPRKK
ncbi:hypothetical protein NX059_000060 [Plenodomus lindquistii]|nr:hypothetical protein NX059_000060 [Plenodomus lindquistii]